MTKSDDHSVNEANRALAKELRGEKLSRDERRLAARLQSKQRQETIDEFTQTCPKGVYCAMAGRQQKVVDQLAHVYGLPLIGSTVNLFSVVKSLHDLIARNSGVIRADGTENWQEEKLKQQIETLKARRQLLQSEIARRRDELVSREDLQRRLQWLSERLRQFATQLGRRYGREAQQLANDTFGQLAGEVEAKSLD
jgi:hypothetical protein